MLRIHRDDPHADTVTLVLQGRIVPEWAELLESECEAWIRSGFCVVLDCADVNFIGRSGIDAIGRLEKSGVRITGCPLLIAAVLQLERIARFVKPQPIGTRKETSP